MSGFLTPTIFNQEIISFFADANIGPLVKGSFIEEKIEFDGQTQFKTVPDFDSLYSVGKLLNEALDFTRPEDPSYGIIAPGSLTPLFALHAHYANMRHVSSHTHLSASIEMRKHLRETMIKVIEKDSAEYNLRQQLIDCIDDQSLVVDTSNLKIFNPNCFPYAHFSKIISAGKDGMALEYLDLTEQRNAINLARAYKNTL